jgi:hypothetical protein
MSTHNTTHPEWSLEMHSTVGLKHRSFLESPLAAPAPLAGTTTSSSLSADLSTVTFAASYRKRFLLVKYLLYIYVEVISTILSYYGGGYLDPRAPKTLLQYCRTSTYNTKATGSRTVAKVLQQWCRGRADCLAQSSYGGDTLNSHYPAY